MYEKSSTIVNPKFVRKNTSICSFAMKELSSYTNRFYMEKKNLVYNFSKPKISDQNSLYCIIFHKHPIKIDKGISARSEICNKFGLFIKSRSNQSQKPSHIGR
jgi:hypothetical protein